MTRIRIDTALRLYHEVLGLDHLHYGLWDGEPANLSGLKSAQVRYAEYLMDWIPDGVESVVDVGAGTGAFSGLLKERGYLVEGLSPDPFQRDLYTERTGRPFHLTGFAEFRGRRPYDLIMLSESAQYVRPPRALFESVVRNAPGGYAVVADYFVTSEEKGLLTKSGHLLDEFLTAAAEQGLELEAEQDITVDVLPTLDCVQGVLGRIQPTLQIIEESWGVKHPILYRTVRWLLRKKFKELDTMAVVADKSEFSRVKRYMIYRFRVPGESMKNFGAAQAPNAA